MNIKWTRRFSSRTVPPCGHENTLQLLQKDGSDEKHAFLQFFSFALSTSISQNIKLKSQNNSFVGHNSLECVILSCKFHCVCTYAIESIQFCLNLHKNHFWASHWWELMSWFFQWYSQTLITRCVLKKRQHFCSEVSFNDQPHQSVPNTLQLAPCWHFTVNQRTEPLVK